VPHQVKIQRGLRPQPNCPIVDFTAQPTVSLVVGCANSGSSGNGEPQESEPVSGATATPPQESQVISDTVPQLDLIIDAGDTVEKRIRAIRLTASWSFSNETGGGGIELDSPHPLQMQPSDFDSATLQIDGLNGVVGLHFSNTDKPQTISAKRWNAEYASGNQDISGVLGKSEPVEISGNTIPVNNGGQLDTATIEVLADNSVTGTANYQVPIKDYFPPPPATPPTDVQLVRDYIQRYMQLITDGDTAELARFLLIDGGVTDRYVKIAERVIEYHAQYDTSKATVQYVYYHEYEMENQYIKKEYIILVRDGRGKMFKVYAGYGDGLVGIDVQMFE